MLQSKDLLEQWVEELNKFLKSFNTIIEQFEEMKKDLVFLLSENENRQN